uniref:NADH dehydrogenase subunit 6 n=1 Tax=Proasellus ibericus TaxID=1281981 RepID=A0A485M7K5_9CRUS|nr:NADH dehydrogenase subunit 6 [Proasellus ibericus]
MISNAPHMLMFSLLASTLLAVVLLGLLNSFPWLSYALFLIFLGGVLILFTYISSLSSTHLFTSGGFKTVASFFILGAVLLLTPEALSEVGGWGLPPHNINMLIKELFTPIFYLIYLYLFAYLLITLLYVVVIMKIYYAPLRSAL